MCDKDIGIVSNFLFCLFHRYEGTPEVAAEKTEIVIKQAIELLYPKAKNHVELREDWIIKYCSYLRYSLDELIDSTKIDREKRQGKL